MTMRTFVASALGLVLLHANAALAAPLPPPSNALARALEEANNSLLEQLEKLPPIKVVRVAAKQDDPDSTARAVTIYEDAFRQPKRLRTDEEKAAGQNDFSNGFAGPRMK